MARECNCVALRAAILSGFPSITTPSFSQRPISGPIPFGGAHDRRPRQGPLAREDILHTSHITRSTPPPSPDMILNFDL
jgi:hypothetical protein